MEGTVSIAEDDDGNITAVYLTVTDGAKKGKYTVTLDAKGKRLGEDAVGSRAKVTGTVATQGNKKALKVTRFELVTEDEEDEGGDDEEE